jgi:hypothetical protein
LHFCLRTAEGSVAGKSVLENSNGSGTVVAVPFELNPGDLVSGLNPGGVVAITQIYHDSSARESWCGSGCWRWSRRRNSRGHDGCGGHWRGGRRSYHRCYRRRCRSGRDNWLWWRNLPTVLPVSGRSVKQIHKQSEKC